MRSALPYFLLTILAVSWLSLRPLLEDRSLGSLSHPIQFMLTPSVDAQRISVNGDLLATFLERETGLHFRTSVPTNFIAVVESFGAGKADIAIMNSFSYLLANAKYGALATLRVLRRDGERSYRGQILARSDAGIQSVEDLRNRRMAYVDPSSTSGYIYPKAFLANRNVVTGEEVFGNKHDIVVTMIYQGQVDAGATYYSAPDATTGEILDARARVKAQFPDVFEKVKILALTDEIPNDPVVFRKDFPEEYRLRIVQALMKYAATKEGRNALREIASIEGLEKTSDVDYMEMKQLIRAHSVDVEKALRQKK